MNYLNRILVKFGYSIKNLKKFNHYPYQRNFNYFNANFDFWIQDEIAAKWYDDEFKNNLLEMKLLDELILKHDNVLEIGVHYGFFASFIASKLSESSNYIGVELQAKGAMYAQSQFCLNGFPPNKVILHAAGSSTSSPLYYFPLENGNASVSQNNKGCKIESVTGDELAKKYGEINLLKLDVEGYEIEVLKGCKNILKRLPKLAIEIHGPLISNFSNTINEIFELIDFSQYEGVMYIRPNNEVIPFSPEAIMGDKIYNIFLTPKNN